MEFFEVASIVEAAFITDTYKQYMWIYLLIAGLIFAVTYVFQAIGLYTIAVREGYGNKWMAFVPFFNTYYIGVVSEKNRVFRSKTQNIAFAAALVEVVYVALYILYYVAKFIIFNGGYAAPEYMPFNGNVNFELVTGYNPVNLPENLYWAWWVFAYLQDYIIYFVQLAFLLLQLFVIIAFFRTYASPHYVLFSLLCVFFPIKGILIFAVRNNNGKNYNDYLREQRQRQYQIYQEYMRNGNGQNGYYGGTGYENGNPYGGQHRKAPPDDPFGGLGASGGENGDNHESRDPFDDLK